MSFHKSQPYGPADSIRLLLIEDDEIDAVFLTRSLRKHTTVSFEIDHVCSLAQAIECLQRTEYDITVIDLSLPDAKNAESFESIRAFDSRIPIVVLTGRNDDAMALFTIESGAQDFLTKDDLSTQALVRTLQFAIVRQRRVLGFQAAADSDSLTGMPNRRNLEAKFAEALEHAGESGQSLAFALFDVDNFKRVNDQYGHGFGDAVLKKIAVLLQHRLDEQMHASRFGGEEFALLMPDMDLASAADTVEEILTELASCAILFDNTTLHVTASAGVVDAVAGDTWKQVYTRCDGALYAAKNSGKNRCFRLSKSEDPPRVSLQR